MATKIKICGLRRLEDIDFVNEAKPDYAGVVMCQRYWRGIDLDQVKAIRRRLNDSIPLVGVFVNDRFMDVLVAMRQGYIDLAQLQGTESEEYIDHLKIMGGKPIIKTCEMNNTDVISYGVNTCADHVMFGTGNGQTFDWSLVRSVQRPYILSGGLSMENIHDAMRQLRPWGVDFMNGVETDGVKDRDKILSVIDTVRSFG